MSDREGVSVGTVVLLVDDLARPRRALATELADAGFDVIEASDGDEAWDCFCRSKPAVVVTDMVMPNSDGIALLNRIRSQSDVPVVLFTARGSIASAATAFKAGADEFVASDDVELDDLVALVGRAAEEYLGGQSAGVEERLVGSSAAMRRVRDQVAGLSQLRTPVLIFGEAGTGRDTVATAIHASGSSRAGQLVRIDPPSTHRPTSLPSTGALYLDDVHLLRSEEQAYWAKRSLNGKDSLRILASSSRPIDRLAESGEFNPDLARSLLRFRIELPPLRSRAEDIPELADHLVARLARSLGRNRIRLSQASLALLSSRRWPGNVAELARVLERAIAFTPGTVLRDSVLADILSETEESLASIRDDHTTREHRELVDAIRTTGGNISHTAAMLGRSRSAIYRLIEKHGIPLARANRR